MLPKLFVFLIGVFKRIKESSIVLFVVVLFLDLLIAQHQRIAYLIVRQWQIFQ